MIEKAEQELTQRSSRKNAFTALYALFRSPRPPMTAQTILVIRELWGSVKVIEEDFNVSSHVYWLFPNYTVDLTYLIKDASLEARQSRYSSSSANLTSVQPMPHWQHTRSEFGHTIGWQNGQNAVYPRASMTNMSYGVAAQYSPGPNSRQAAWDPNGPYGSAPLGSTANNFGHPQPAPPPDAAYGLQMRITTDYESLL